MTIETTAAHYGYANIRIDSDDTFAINAAQNEFGLTIAQNKGGFTDFITTSAVARKFAEYCE